MDGLVQTISEEQHRFVKKIRELMAIMQMIIDLLLAMFQSDKRLSL